METAHDDAHLVTDTTGTLHALVPILGWLRDAVGARESDLVPGVRELVSALGLEPHGDTLDELVAGLDAGVPGLAASVRDLSPSDARRLLDAADRELRAAGRAVADVALPSGPGQVTSVHISDGGVPKRSVPGAEIGLRGLVGDQQASRRHHGKPLQAVCLYSSEVVAALAEEGHPIVPGAVGENLSIAGLDWEAMRPCVRLGIGSALVEVSAPATPCDKNARWFVDGDIDRMSHEHHPGWSRWYAWVLEPGTVAPGDPVTVEP